MPFLPEGAILMMTNATADEHERKAGFFYCAIVDPTWPKLAQEQAIVAHTDPYTCLQMALKRYRSISNAQTTEVPNPGA